MSRYIDADRLKKSFRATTFRGNKFVGIFDVFIDEQPTADVRKNVHAKKVIGGGERDGSTCWFECSHCRGTVDLQDMFCKHCGAVLEYEK